MAMALRLKQPSDAATSCVVCALRHGRVGAYNADGNLASFSNYGKSSVTLLAPGERIYSTYPNNNFTFLSGTSMATPHVSGGCLHSLPPTLVCCL